jgi:hypothetical protein
LGDSARGRLEVDEAGVEMRDGYVEFVAVEEREDELKLAELSAVPCKVR